MAKDTPWISEPAGMSFVFGPFRLFPMQRLLTESRKPVRLGSRAFDILIALLERPGELVTKEELMARVWPNTFVAPANLAVHISALRRALGDGRQESRYVINIPGRGYRFVAPVTAVEDCQTSAAAIESGREQNLPARFTPPTAQAEMVELTQQLQQRRLLAIVGRNGREPAVALAVLEKLIRAHDNDVWLVDLGSLEKS